MSPFLKKHTINVFVLLNSQTTFEALVKKAAVRSIVLIYLVLIYPYWY